jgi:hypothetical protein
VANPGGIQDADRDGGLMQGSHNVSFVTAGGFTDDLNGGVRGQEFQELAIGRRRCWAGRGNDRPGGVAG